MTMVKRNILIPKMRNVLVCTYTTFRTETKRMTEGNVHQKEANFNPSISCCLLLIQPKYVLYVPFY